MTEPITVITPCFNAGPFLLRCLQSVAAQGECVRQHLVFDGESRDGSVAILREFGKSNPKLKWVSEPDGGQSDALNKALLQVGTSYFAWLNADDCLLPAKLESLSLESQSSPAPAIVYGDYLVIDSADRVLKARPQPSFNYWDCLYGYLTVQNCAAIFHTDLCKSIGGFNRQLQFCMDYELIVKLAQRGSVLHVREYVGCFRQHENAKTSKLPDVCARETAELRQSISGKSGISLQARYLLSKARVTGRMIREGCISSRLTLGRGRRELSARTVRVDESEGDSGEI